MTGADAGLTALLAAGNAAGAHLTFRFLVRLSHPDADPGELRRRVRRADAMLALFLPGIVAFQMIIGSSLMGAVAKVALAWVPWLGMYAVHGNSLKVGPLDPITPTHQPDVPVGVAWNDSTTRAGLRRYRLKAIGWFAASFLLLCGSGAALPADPNETNTMTTAMPLVLAVLMLMGAAAIVTLWRGWRWKRLLRAEPWQPMPVRFGLHGESLVLEVDPVNGPPVLVSPLLLAPWRRRSLRAHPITTVWIVGDPKGAFLATPDAGRSFIWLGHAHSKGERRRRKAVFS